MPEAFSPLSRSTGDVTPIRELRGQQNRFRNPYPAAATAAGAAPGNPTGAPSGRRQERGNVLRLDAYKARTVSRLWRSLADFFVLNSRSLDRSVESAFRLISR
jgi:hypothetical protein